MNLKIKHKRAKVNIRESYCRALLLTLEIELFISRSHGLYTLIFTNGVMRIPNPSLPI